MSGSLLSAIVRPELAELAAYSTEPARYRVRLDANEAPPLLSSRAQARIREALTEGSFERYPDPSLGAARRAIARSLGVSPEEILAGVGSDEVITLLLTALVRPPSGSDVATVLTTTPSFVMYRLSARVRGLRVLEVPLDERWDLAVSSLSSALDLSPPNLVFIASPNNPTGNLVSPERLEALIRRAPSTLFVIDEAYVAYAARDQLEFYRRHDNVAILRTLSKVGFAAFRFGFLLGRRELIRELDKVRLPYNVPSASQRVAELVFAELQPDLNELVGTVVAERARVAEALSARTALSVSPSDANFLWVRTEAPAAGIFEALKERGILVRSFHPRGGRLAHQLRITIGTKAENDELIAALTELT